MTRGLWLAFALIGCTDILGVTDRNLVEDGGAPAAGGGGASTGGAPPTGAGVPDGGGGSGGAGGSSAPCPLLSCDGSCVNPFTDDAHCGYCGVACEEGHSCRNGSCDQRLHPSPGGRQCARYADSVYCWGDTYNGQSGTGVAQVATTFPAQEVTILDGLPSPRFITQSGDAACALLDDGSIRCFGDNSTGGLGTGALGGPDAGAAGAECCHIAEPAEPVFPADTVFVDVAAGAVSWEPEFFVALTESGDVYCWGNGATTPFVKLTNAVQVIAGVAFACALDDAGKVSCWGSPWTSGVDDPICGRPIETFEELPPIRRIGGAHYSGFAISQDDEVYAWGSNRYGTLGPSFVPNVSYYPPRRMTHEFRSPVVQIAGAHWATCALLLDGAIYCWGRRGFLGNGSDFDDATVTEPARALLGAASEISAGYDDLSAIDASGAVLVWSRWYHVSPDDVEL